jgi:hypothetical protein
MDLGIETYRPLRRLLPALIPRALLLEPLRLQILCLVPLRLERLRVPQRAAELLRLVRRLRRGGQVVGRQVGGRQVRSGREVRLKCPLVALRLLVGLGELLLTRVPRIAVRLR